MTMQFWTAISPPDEDPQRILREEVEIAVAALKKRKSARIDNISAELVQTGEKTIIDVLTEICNKVWRTGEWPIPWTQSLIITLPKKGNLQVCQNYRIISLITHPNKVMLKTILNRLKLQVEELIAEEQGPVSEPEEASRDTLSTSESCVKSISNINKICTVSSLSSRKSSTGYIMQLYGPPCRSIILMQI